MSVRTGQTLWGYCIFYTVSLKIMIGYITPITPPPDTYTAIPHSGGTPTMQVYSHNIILYIYLLPQYTSYKLFYPYNDKQAILAFKITMILQLY